MEPVRVDVKDAKTTQEKKPEPEEQKPASELTIGKIWIYDQYNEWICLEESGERKARLEREEKQKEEEQKTEKLKEFETRLADEDEDKEEVQKQKEAWLKEQEEAQKKKDEEKQKADDEAAEKKKKEEEENAAYEEIEDWEVVKAKQFALHKERGPVFILEAKEEGKIVAVDRDGVFEATNFEVEKALEFDVVVHTEEATYDSKLKVDVNGSVRSFLREKLKAQLKENFIFSSFMCFVDDLKIEFVKKVKEENDYDALKKAHDEERAKEKEVWKKNKEEIDKQREELIKQEEERLKKEEEEAKKAAGEGDNAEKTEEGKDQGEAAKEGEGQGEAQNQPEPDKEEIKEGGAPEGEDKKEAENEDKEKKEAGEPEQTEYQKKLAELTVKPYVQKDTKFEVRFNQLLKTNAVINEEAETLQVHKEAKVAQIKQLVGAKTPTIEVVITRPVSLRTTQLYSTILYQCETEPQLTFSPNKPILLSGFGLFGPFPNSKGVQAFEFKFSIKNIRTKAQEFVKAKVIDQDERVWKFFLDEEIFVDKGDFVHIVPVEKKGGVFCLTSPGMYFYGDGEDGGVRFSVGNHFRNGVTSLYYRRIFEKEN